MHMAAYIGMVSKDTYSWILGKKISGPVSRKETKDYKGWIPARFRSAGLESKVNVVQ